jgi:HK97 family phage major capsid protein
MSLEEARRRIGELHEAAADREFTDDERAEWNRLNRFCDEQETRQRIARRRRGESHGLAVEDRTSSGAVAEPGRHDTLTRDQSLADWGERRGLRGFTPENRGLSFDRMVRGMVSGEWDGAEDELRALTEVPTSAGGFMVPTPVAASVIDKARNAAVTMRAGAVTVPMAAQTLKYPRLLTEGSPGWRDEASATLADQAMSFDSITFTARTLAMLVKISVELFEDADPADDVVENSFAQQIALELDRVAIRGSGTAPEPRGVRNQSGVTIVNHGTNGTQIGPLGTGLGYDFLLDAVGTCRASNFEPNAVIAAPRLETSLGKLKEATTNAYADAPAVDVLPRYSSNSIPTNLTVGTSTDCSEVFTGEWRHLLIGMRTQLTLRFLQERYLDDLDYAFLAWLRADVQLAQPAAFVVDLGVRG